MTDFSNFLDDVRLWVGRKDYSDAVVTSFVRMAETSLSQTMRVGKMVVRSEAIATEGRIALPADFLEAEMVRFPSGKPLEYKDPDTFYSAVNKGSRWYTILGQEIEFGAPIDAIEGLSVSMSYFQHVPAFTEASTWLHRYYYNIFLQSCNAAAALYGQEFDRATALEGLVSGMVSAANDTYTRGKTSGSVLRVGNPKRIG